MAVASSASDVRRGLHGSAPMYEFSGLLWCSVSFWECKLSDSLSFVLPSLLVEARLCCRFVDQISSSQSCSDVLFLIRAVLPVIEVSKLGACWLETHLLDPLLPRFLFISFLTQDVRCGLFPVPEKMHRSVTTRILLPDMFVRCNTRKHGKLRNFDGYCFCVRQDAKKGTALHDGVGSLTFFRATRQQSFKGSQLTIQPAFEYADRAYFVHSTPLYFSCLFLHFGRMPFSFC